MKPFEQYIRLLFDLHVEVEAGRGDDEKADNIRYDMETPWHKMSNRERELTNAVSAALYPDNRLDKHRLKIEWNKS